MANAKKYQPKDVNEQAASISNLDELNFSDDAEPSFATAQREVDESDTVEERQELDERGERHTNPDEIDPNELTPETLIKEDGARSPHEPGGSIAAEEDLSVVGIDNIGAGYGLDEEELARVQPLDGNSSAKKPTRK